MSDDNIAARITNLVDEMKAAHTNPEPAQAEDDEDEVFGELEQFVERTPPARWWTGENDDGTD